MRWIHARHGLTFDLQSYNERRARRRLSATHDSAIRADPSLRDNQRREVPPPFSVGDIEEPCCLGRYIMQVHILTRQPADRAAKIAAADEIECLRDRHQIPVRIFRFHT